MRALKNRRPAILAAGLLLCLGWLILTFATPAARSLASARYPLPVDRVGGQRGTIMSRAAPASTSGRSAASPLAPALDADLSASMKQADKGAVQPGEMLTYTITLVNTGVEAAADVRLIDTLPAEVEYAGGLWFSAGSAEWDSENRQITWAGAVEPDLDVVIRFQARVKPGIIEGTPILNWANLFYRDQAYILSAETRVGRIKLFLPLLRRHACFDPDISEPNGSISTARGPLCPKHVYRATIDSPKDVNDIYWIRVRRAATLGVDLTNIPAEVDYDLAVYDEQVTKLAESIENGNMDEHIEVAVGPGKYYIQVYQRQGYSATEHYALSWRLR